MKSLKFARVSDHTELLAAEVRRLWETGALKMTADDLQAVLDSFEKLVKVFYAEARASALEEGSTLSDEDAEQFAGACVLYFGAQFENFFSAALHFYMALSVFYAPQVFLAKKEGVTTLRHALPENKDIIIEKAELAMKAHGFNLPTRGPGKPPMWSRSNLKAAIRSAMKSLPIRLVTYPKVAELLGLPSGPALRMLCKQHGVDFQSLKKRS